MNRTLLVLFFIIIALSFNAKATSNQYFPPTASQTHFTAIVNGLPGVVNASWRTPVSLWVKVSSKAVGSPPSQEKAQGLADILADRGRTALFQPFCVHIYNKKDNELSKKCVY
ncbi:MAG: hypothetical protein ACR2NW_10540 [Thermodesulfobacteriota bacterium]